MAGLEYGADLHGEQLAAVIALVHAYADALALHLAILLDPTTLRTDWARRPDTRFYERIRRFLVVEVRGGKDGIGHRWLPI